MVYRLWFILFWFVSQDLYILINKITVKELSFNFYVFTIEKNPQIWRLFFGASSFFFDSTFDEKKEVVLCVRLTGKNKIC